VTRFAPTSLNYQGNYQGRYYDQGQPYGSHKLSNILSIVFQDYNKIYKNSCKKDMPKSEKTKKNSQDMFLVIFAETLNFTHQIVFGGIGYEKTGANHTVGLSPVSRQDATISPRTQKLRPSSSQNSIKGSYVTPNL
jgi:hypothetical protein